MDTNDGSGRDGFSRLLTWVIIGVVALVALRVGLMLLGLATFVLFKLGPILLVGWVIVMGVRYLSRKPPAPDGV